MNSSSLRTALVVILMQSSPTSSCSLRPTWYLMESSEKCGSRMLRTESLTTSCWTRATAACGSLTAELSSVGFVTTSDPISGLTSVGSASRAGSREGT